MTHIFYTSPQLKIDAFEALLHFSPNFSVWWQCKYGTVLNKWTQNFSWTRVPSFAFLLLWKLISISDLIQSALWNLWTAFSRMD
jgi:hypothetical protein